MFSPEAHRGDRAGSLVCALGGLLLALSLSLTACGGGGGGSGSNGGGSGGGATVLSASTANVSATVSPTAAAPGLQVNLSVANPPTGGTLYSATTFGGTAVSSASIIWSPNLVNGAQSGALELMLYLPAFIGSGTFHDTVSIAVCTDSKCAQQIAGSPVSVAVTYTVTGNAVSDASYVVLPTTLAFDVPSNGAGPSTIVNVTAYDVPPYGAYVFYTSETGGPVASMSFQQTSANAEPYAYGTGALTVNMKLPASLGPGTYNDLITLSICYDTACLKPAAGTPFKIPVTYTVTASAGREFQEQVIQQNLSALAVDSTGSVLYGTTIPVSGGPPAQLLEINPTTGAVSTLLNLPALVAQIAPSRDGSYLYVLTGFSVASQLSPPIQVIRVRTSDMTIDQTVPLSSSTNEPAQIAVSPLDSNTWSAAFTNQANVWSVAIFDGAVARPNPWSTTSDVVYGNEGLWSSDASTLYILDANLNAVPVSASGLGSGTLLQAGSAAQQGFSYGGNLQLAGGHIYSASGEVLDPNTNTILGQYKLPAGVPYAALTIDTTNNHMFASFDATVATTAGSSDEGTIESFNLSTFNPIWIARLPIGTQPVRWGSNGLAWLGPGATMGTQALYLINGTFVAP